MNIMFGGSGPGSSPILENISRGMLGVIGIWMIWRAFSRRSHHHDSRGGVAFGVTAGLIPCPLTLFIMNFAVLHQVVDVGVLFAVMMIMGIGVTLGAVALTAALFREQAARLLASRPQSLERVSKVLEVAAGVVLLAVAVAEIARS